MTDVNYFGYFDKGAIIASILSFAFYHIYTFTSVFCLHNVNIQLARNIANSFIWIQKHRMHVDAASVTLAVQTLRNTILVSIFVGGSAFQYGFLFLNTPSNSLREQARQIILSILLFASFLCWANTIRYANHLAYTIGALDFQIKLIESREALEQQEKEKYKSSTLTRDADAEVELDIEIGNGNENVNENEKKFEKKSESDPRFTNENGKNDKHKNEVKFLVSEGVSHPHRTVDEVLDGLKSLSVSMLSSFSLGFRFLFVAIPFGFYSAGPLALVIATAVILIFLINIDHVEKSTYSFMAGFAHIGKSIKSI